MIPWLQLFIHRQIFHFYYFTDKNTIILRVDVIFVEHLSKIMFSLIRRFYLIFYYLLLMVRVTNYIFTLIDSFLVIAISLCRIVSESRSSWFINFFIQIINITAPFGAITGGAMISKTISLIFLFIGLKEKIVSVNDPLFFVKNFRVNYFLNRLWFWRFIKIWVITIFKSVVIISLSICLIDKFIYFLGFLNQLFYLLYSFILCYNRVLNL